MAVIQILLYGVLGVLLSLGGITVSEQPVLTVALICVVLAIDMISAAKL